MAKIRPYQSFYEFCRQYPDRQHSSRTMSLPCLAQVIVSAAVATIQASVADAIIQDVAGVSASVADALIQTVSTGSSSTLAFGATSLVFSSTTVGSNTDMTVTISNPGTADLVINSIVPTGDFSVSSITGN
jgi:hypothetical protein